MATPSHPIVHRIDPKKASVSIIIPRKGNREISEASKQEGIDKGILLDANISPREEFLKEISQSVSKRRSIWEARKPHLVASRSTATDAVHHESGIATPGSSPSTQSSTDSRSSTSSRPSTRSPSSSSNSLHVVRGVSNSNKLVS